MNIDEITKQGITRIRLAKWANPDAYIELLKFDDGQYGPWATLHDEWGETAFTKEEYDKIKKLLIWELKDEPDWIEYIPKRSTKITKDSNGNPMICFRCGGTEFEDDGVIVWCVKCDLIRGHENHVTEEERQKWKTQICMVCGDTAIQGTGLCPKCAEFGRKHQTNP